MWRRVLEATAAEQASFDQGMTSLVNAAGFFTTVLMKANMTLTAEGTEVSVEDGIAAGREMSKLLAQGDNMARWAKVHATQARIIEVMKSLPEEYQQMVLAKLDGRPWPPPSAPRLALIEGTVASDQEADPFDDDARLKDFDTED